MNKDNAKDYLPLVQALADGKTIQFMPQGEDISTQNFPRDKWTDLPEPRGVNFFSPANRYRIKPEPRELDLWIHKNGQVYKWVPDSDPAFWAEHGYTRITVREVM